MSSLDEAFKTTKFNSIELEISNCKCEKIWTNERPPKLVKIIKCDYCKNKSELNKY
jgi:hypothetical protein